MCARSESGHPRFNGMLLYVNLNTSELLRAACLVQNVVTVRIKQWGQYSGYSGPREDWGERELIVQTVVLDPLCNLKN